MTFDLPQKTESPEREADHRSVEKAVRILRDYRNQLEEGAKLLLEKEALTREEFPPLQRTSTSDVAATTAPI